MGFVVCIFLVVYPGLFAPCSSNVLMLYEPHVAKSIENTFLDHDHMLPVTYTQLNTDDTGQQFQSRTLRGDYNGGLGLLLAS